MFEGERTPRKGSRLEGGTLGETLCLVGQTFLSALHSGQTGMSAPPVLSENPRAMVQERAPNERMIQRAAFQHIPLSLVDVLVDKGDGLSARLIELKSLMAKQLQQATHGLPFTRRFGKRFAG